jgi:hypothetical protein
VSPEEITQSIERMAQAPPELFERVRNLLKIGG